MSEPARKTDPSGSALLTRDMMYIFDTYQDGAIFVARDWCLVYANSHAFDIAKMDERDLHSKTIWQVFPAIVGTELDRTLRQVMDERRDRALLYFYEPLQLWIDQRVIPIESGIAILFSDVTAQKLEEIARASLMQRLEQVLDATTDAIFYLDWDYNFAFLNRRAKELLAPEGDVLGSNIWARFPAAHYEGSPFVENYRRSMEHRVPCQFEAYYPEPLNMWICVECGPAQDGIIVLYRDLTEERSNREELLRQADKAERRSVEIETIYCAAPVGLALFDAEEFHYLRLNDKQAMSFGLPAERFIGEKVDFMTTIPGLTDIFRLAAAGQPVLDRHIEGELATCPDEHRHWTINLLPVYGPEGKVKAISTAWLEITKQKAAEAALIQNEKLAALGRLASTISHEINNPLESITNLLYLIATDESLPESLRDYVETAQGELTRVTQITTQTLRFHKQSTLPTRTCASRLMQDVVDLYRNRLRDVGITLDTRYMSDTLFLCYENDVRQVMNNLISNALDAMRGGGRLIIRSHDVPGHGEGSRSGGGAGVRITVADTGHGMSKATMARIFEPFFTTKELNGTGLGLWVSSEIVKRHGGRLSLMSSQRPSLHGTVFSVYLPLVCA